MPLNEVVPVRFGDRWLVQDRTGAQLTVGASFNRGWHLLALSGGRPMSIFAEWDGSTVFPLSALSEGEFVLLAT